jgi:solute carrier family 25 (mitochondrial phosphate transporter), member 23/24/25/41
MVPTSGTASALLSIRQFVRQPTVASFIAGGTAGAVSRTLVSPLERMKIIFQVQIPGNKSYSGIWATLGKIYKEEGVMGYLRGNGTNCIRIIPYSATQFAAYSIYKKVYSSLV